MNGARGRKKTQKSGLLAITGLVLAGTGWALWQGAGVDAQPTARPAAGTEPPAAGGRMVGAIPVPNRSSGIHLDLFDRPLETPSKKARRTPPVPPAAGPAPQLVKENPPDPLADYVYTGAVTLNGERYALLEHRKTHEGIYLKTGEVFNGYTAGSFDAQQLTLDAPSGVRTLAMNDKYDLTPLDRDADGGRATSHDRSEVALDTQREAYSSAMQRALLANSSVRLLNWVGNSQDVEHLKNEVFEGRMTQEEFDRRTSGSLNTSLYFHYTVGHVY